jgi:U4/U6.U5 tri-snRNP component SNU23
MRVERSTKDQVASRLEMLAKEQEKAKHSLLNPVAEENFHDMVKAKDEEERRRKEERAQKRKDRKKKLKQEVAQEDEEEETEEAEEETIDPALAAMMGFSGFGGGSKNS